MLSRLLDKLFKDTPDNDAFAQRFIAAARRSGITAELHYDAELFQIRQEGGGYTCNLTNAHRAYLDAPRGKQQQALETFVRGMHLGTRREADWDTLRPLLRPIIRSISQLEQLRLQTAIDHGWDTPNHLQYRRLTDECIEMLAIDYDEHMETKANGPDAEWGVSLHEALDIARGNLRGLDQVPFQAITPGLFRAAWEDSYDSSRALLPELINRVPVNGRPVFMLPTRDVLMVAGDRDPDAQALMLALAQHAFEDGRVISWELLRHDDNGRIEACPPATEALQVQQDRLRQLLRQGDYQTQQQLLRRIHEAQGEDIHVATFLLMEKDGVARSICSWSPGVAASLPRTDQLGLSIPTEGEPRIAFVDWDAAMPIVGHLLEQDPRHLHPPRYLTRGYPTEQQLAELTA